MAPRKKTASKKSSSGSGPKSKRIVHNKMEKTMHEFKHHELKSGGGRKVNNPKQAIAIGLSEARRSGADIPENPNQKKTASKGTRKRTTKKSTAKKSAPKKTAHKRSGNKSTARKTSSGRSRSKRATTKRTSSKRPRAKRR